MSPTYQLNCLLNKTWFYNLKVFFIFPGTVGLTMLVFFCFQTSLYLISTKNWKYSSIDRPNLWVLCTFHHAFKWPKKKKNQNTCPYINSTKLFYVETQFSTFQPKVFVKYRKICINIQIHICFQIHLYLVSIKNWKYS